MGSGRYNHTVNRTERWSPALYETNVYATHSSPVVARTTTAGCGIGGAIATSGTTPANPDGRVAPWHYAAEARARNGKNLRGPCVARRFSPEGRGDAAGGPTARDRPAVSRTVKNDEVRGTRRLTQYQDAASRPHVPGVLSSAELCWRWRRWWRWRRCGRLTHITHDAKPERTVRYFGARGYCGTGRGRAARSLESPPPPPPCRGSSAHAAPARQQPSGFQRARWPAGWEASNGRRGGKEKEPPPPPPLGRARRLGPATRRVLRCRGAGRVAAPRPRRRSEESESPGRPWARTPRRWRHTHTRTRTRSPADRVRPSRHAVREPCKTTTIIGAVRFGRTNNRGQNISAPLPWFYSPWPEGGFAIQTLRPSILDVQWHYSVSITTVYD